MILTERLGNVVGIVLRSLFLWQGQNHGLTTLALNLDWRAVLDIQAHFLCLQERSAPVPIQLVIHQPMSEVFRRFSFGVLKRCHQVYPLSIFSHDTNV